ncbi:MAG TPA: aminopeptidase P family protein, partial [Thermopetrobacter sp.]|nr:aminopeptidase P family protein [Thermopetrobacter sp.]
MVSGMDAPVHESRFQSFVETGRPEKAAERLALLRDRMAAQRIDAYVVARSDAWGNEYIRACDERLAWLSGFTGSAGLLIVTADIAALFVDGRYTLQAARQVDTNVITVVALADTSPEEWLAERLKDGRAVSADAFTEAGRRRFAKRGVTLHFGPDLVAEIWQDRPVPPNRPLFAQPEELTGKSATAKLADIRRALAERQADAAFITSTDSVSWLFNIRGRDIPHTPVALAMALVPMDGKATLFVPDVAMAADVRESLADVATFEAMEEIEAHLKQLKGQRVLCDPARSAARYFDVLREAGATVIEADDPCLLPKAVKTAAEQDGMRAAHVRDGVAL